MCITPLPPGHKLTAREAGFCFLAEASKRRFILRGEIRREGLAGTSGSGCPIAERNVPSVAHQDRALASASPPTVES